MRQFNSERKVNNNFNYIPLESIGGLYTNTVHLTTMPQNIANDFDNLDVQYNFDPILNQLYSRPSDNKVFKIVANASHFDDTSNENDDISLCGSKTTI